jgi:hypothetical protein
VDPTSVENLITIGERQEVHVSKLDNFHSRKSLVESDRLQSERIESFNAKYRTIDERPPLLPDIKTKIANLLVSNRSVADYSGHKYSLVRPADK